MTNRLHHILLASLFAAVASGVGGFPDSIEFEHILVNPDFGGGDCKGLADIDGDGKLDVIAGNKKDLAWYRFPDWRKTVIAPAKQEFTTDMQVADMDADGDPDMVAPDGRAGRNLVVRESSSQGRPFRHCLEKTCRWLPGRLGP